MRKQKKIVGVDPGVPLKELKANPKLPFEDEAIKGAMALLPKRVADMDAFTHKLDYPNNETSSTPKVAVAGHEIKLFNWMPNLRFQVSKGDKDIGYSSIEFSPDEDHLYIARVEVKVFGGDFSGLLCRIAIASARKYGLSEVHSCPDAPQTLVWLLREGFQLQTYTGDTKPKLEGEIRALVLEGQGLPDSQKKLKYSGALRIFRQEDDRLHTKSRKRDGLIMVKNL